MRLARISFLSLLTLATSVMAKGNVVIHNRCPFPVHRCTVAMNENRAEGVIQPGERYEEPYIIPPSLDGSFGGTSIKLGKDPTGAGPITQLEYTWASAGIANDMFWYDLSNVNCGPDSQTNTGACPFVEGGMHLRVKHNEQCQRRVCKSGDLRCNLVYYLTDDDAATAGCQNGQRDDLVMQLCQDHTRFSPGFRKHPRDFSLEDE